MINNQFNIPEDLRNQAYKYLPDDLLKILNTFETKYGDIAHIDYELVGIEDCICKRLQPNEKIYSDNTLAGDVDGSCYHGCPQEER